MSDVEFYKQQIDYLTDLAVKNETRTNEVYNQNIKLQITMRKLIHLVDGMVIEATECIDYENCGTFQIGDFRKRYTEFKKEINKLKILSDINELYE